MRVGFVAGANIETGMVVGVDKHGWLIPMGIEPQQSNSNKGETQMNDLMRLAMERAVERFNVKNNSGLFDLPSLAFELNRLTSLDKSKRDIWDRYVLRALLTGRADVELMGGDNFRLVE